MIHEAGFAGFIAPAAGFNTGLLWRNPLGNLSLEAKGDYFTNDEVRRRLSLNQQWELSRNLGFTARRTLTWETTEEVTAALRRLDPDDPVRFDFSLCHLGMLQRCPSKRDAVRCEGCGIKSVCLHWARGATRRAQGM